MGKEVTCTLSNRGEVIAEGNVEANSQAVAKNGALMKVASDIDLDVEDYTIACE